jgi:hypothetical protein
MPRGRLGRSVPEVPLRVLPRPSSSQSHTPPETPFLITNATTCYRSSRLTTTPFIVPTYHPQESWFAKPTTPKGLAYFSEWGSNRWAANTAFLALLAADYGIQPDEYRTWGRTQV